MMVSEGPCHQGHFVGNTTKNLSTSNGPCAILCRSLRDLVSILQLRLEEPQDPWFLRGPTQCFASHSSGLPRMLAMGLCSREACLGFPL